MTRRPDDCRGILPGTIIRSEDEPGAVAARASEVRLSVLSLDSAAKEGAPNPAKIGVI